MIAGALDWWRDAGVEHSFADDPVHWLEADESLPDQPQKPAGDLNVAPPEASNKNPEPAPIAVFDAASLPADHTAFTDWWLTEAALADGPASIRVAPRGKPGADLMVIVPEPEAQDSEVLLSGPQGRLLNAMLSAFEIAPDKAYIASALPRHMPAADWEGLAARGLGTVMAHHVALVRPARLIVFGTGILPLIGHGPPQGPAELRNLDHGDTKVPMLACRSLAALIEQPRWKARIWQAWLDWTK